jgi:hypothetical protein
MGAGSSVPSSRIDVRLEEASIKLEHSSMSW